MSSHSFTEQKKKVISDIEKLINEYDLLTTEVSPKHYRVTGSHFCELRKMLIDVKDLTEITEEQRIAWEKFEKGKNGEAPSGF
jgi:DNA-binding ferritin-like protein